jgi:hypothetical protein
LTGGWVLSVLSAAGGGLAAGVSAGAGPAGPDERVIDVDSQADGRGRLLGDADLADVVGLDRIGLVLEDGVELGLEDVDVDPVRPAELAGDVLAQLADIEDDPGEIGMGVAAKVDDLDPGIGLRGRREGENQRQDREPEARRCGFQFISIL